MGCETIFSEDFCTALDSTTLPIYIIDPETFEMLYCNETMREALGRNPIGERCHKAIRGADEPCPSCVALRLFRDGICESKEYLTPQGRWVLVRVSPLNWRGRLLYKVTCIDITLQKQLENELRLRDREHAAFMQQSTKGVLRYDIAADIGSINVDRNLDRVEEYTIPNYAKVIGNSGLVTPESEETARAVLQDLRAGRPSKGYDVQLNLERDGLRWYHVDYVVIEDDAGKPYRALLTFYDNTEQREKELAYQNWNARLNTLMNEYTAYMEVNLNRDIIEAEGRAGSWDQERKGRRYSLFVADMSRRGIHREDARSFQRFLDRERLLGQFYAGRSGGTLEYRAMVDGAARWYKAELQMVSDPATGDVKTSIMFSDVDTARRERERLMQEAERDALTGLYNRAATEHLIQQALEQNTGERCCFLMIDLDDLRDINSYLGHPEGDRALKAIADCLLAQFPRGRVLGRVGGDEFVGFLRNAPSEEKLCAALSSLMRRLAGTGIGPMNNRPVRASIGAVVCELGHVDYKTMYERADLALYYTKAMGKNNFHFYDPQMERRTFSYQPRSAATLTREEGFDSAEYRRLMTAVSAYFPMVISANLTRNTYAMLEYASYAMQKHRDEGCFDDLIHDGALSFHPDDQESFRQAFGRENLLRAFAEGRRFVHHSGWQRGDDGVYRMTYAVVILMKDEETGDIHDICFSHTARPGMEPIG